MGKYAFTWAIRPPPSRRRREIQTINGFEVEITFRRIKRSCEIIFGSGMFIR